MKFLYDLLVSVLLYAFFFAARWQKQGRYAFVVKTVFYGYLVGLLYVTLMPVLAALPSAFTHPYTNVNLIPFYDVRMNYGGAVRQVVLNALMTVPLGFLLPAVRHKSVWQTVGWTFLISLCIEVVQPILSSARYADITDLITNTAGGLVGYLLYLLMKKTIDKWREKA